MTTAKRLGSTVFSDNDPLDDLRPTRQKKVFALPAESTPPQNEPTESARTDPAEVTLDQSMPMPTAGVGEGEAAVAPPPVQNTPPVIPKEKAKVAEEEELRGRVRFSANIPVATKRRVENAAYWIPGMTISAITEVALERELKRLEKEYSDGKPFERAGKLRYGRPRADD